MPVEIDGRERWLSISGVAFVEGTVYAFRDLTEEYAIERLKSDFVSTVSHELRTPLAAIYGAAMTLQRTDVALGDDQRIGLLGVVAGESERLARIVNDVLWASRLDSGVLEVSIENCDAGALATAVVAAARVHLPSTIELTLAVEKGISAVAADADKVRQVLVNLVDNAIKYSPDGGLVEVRVEAADHGVRFVVSDRGLGIPPTEHGRIFEKFFRLDPNLTRGVGGTGLGLYICRELIRRMDGRIWVESEEGSGSIFTFELPEASSARGPASAGPRAAVVFRSCVLVRRAVLDVRRAAHAALAEVAGAAPRRPEEQAQQQAGNTHHEQDHADGRDVQSGHLGVHGPGEDGADCDQEKAHSKTHFVVLLVHRFQRVG